MRNTWAELEMADRIRLLREAQCPSLTVAEAARRAGVWPKAISRCESGQSDIRVGLLQKLADVYGVRLMDLVGNEPPPIVRAALEHSIASHTADSDSGASVRATKQSRGSTGARKRRRKVA